MTTQSLSPEQIRRLRVIYRTQDDFLREHNVIADPDRHPSRQQIRRLVGELCYSERKSLENRVQRRLNSLDALMDGDAKQFDKPAVEHSDLVDGVRIPDFNE